MQEQKAFRLILAARFARRTHHSPHSHRSTQNGREGDGDWIIFYADGSKYAGLCENGQPEGRGLLKLSNEDVYTGFFRGGLRHGEGVVVFAGGDSFEGQWRQVREWIEERIVETDDLNAGNLILFVHRPAPSRLIVQDQPVGLNIFIGDSPTRNRKKQPKQIVGEVTDFTLSEIRLSDEGEEEERGEGKLDGGQGKGQGKGGDTPSYTYENGDKYFGSIDSNGLRQGRGIYIVKRTGARYEGMFRDNKRDGHGTLAADSSVFTGFFSNNAFLNGTFVVRSLFTYRGKFKDDEFHDDAGELCDWDGTTYSGAFVGGVKEGTGKITYPDGSIFVGEFKRNKRDGEGTVKKGDDFIYCGCWRNDAYHGHGILNLQHGSYEGGFVNGLYSGFGKLTTKKRR